jgi:hypothetical protein
MVKEIIGLISQGAKTLLGKKSTQEIIKYLATVTINHISNKYNINQYKYDQNDIKNMIYHYNMNNDNIINKNNVDDMINLMNINRFSNELKYSQNLSSDPMEEILNNLYHIIQDNNINNMYSDMRNNNIMQQFDLDTLETSSIADNYEISSGGIYLPDNDIYTSTIEGCNLANAKNEYLEKRIMLGEEANIKDVEKILNEYYEKIDFNKVAQYFNN